VSHADTKSAPRFPASYENVAVREAVESLALEPQPGGLDTLLSAALRGGLVIDVTGSTAETGTQLRTIATSDGQPVLPLFTSMEKLRHAVAASLEGEGAEFQAVVIPSREALSLIFTADFVAVQFNPGGISMVVARSHIESALSGHGA
jgi:hypothetical protein